MKKHYIFIFLIWISLSQILKAQEKLRFWDDVQAIKRYDKIYTPPSHPILFIGSSSIRMWKNLERTFADYVVLNRGLGGAVINDLAPLLNDIVLPYQPRQLVIYVGDNDLTNELLSADSIFIRTKRLISSIRTKLPITPIVYISIKPSPSRIKFLNKAITVNQLIKNHIATERNIRYLDIFNLMLTSEGKPDACLFLSDMLHLNEKGYKIWNNALKPLLLKK